MRAGIFIALVWLVAAPAVGQSPSSFADPCASDEVTIPIRFDLYRGRLDDAELPLLDRLAQLLLACPARAFELQVHTDTVRLTSFNARQSRAVADHVRDLLVARGVPASRLVPCGYGESRPLSRDPSWDQRSPNQRLVIRALPSAAHVCPAL